MKYKIKILPKLIGVLVILLMTNCAKDEFFEQIKNSNDISLEQFKRETGISNFSTSLKINNNQNSLEARNPDGTYELSDFIIDTEIIKKYVVDEKVTYTFKIIPVDIVNDKIYNLTYFYKDGWQTIVLELKPTEENLSLLRQGLTTIFEGTATRLFQSDLPSPVAQWCVTINFTNSHCTGTGPCESGVCDQCELCVSSGSATICGPDEISVLYIDAGPSTSGGGPGDGTGGNGNTGSPSNPTDTEISIIPNLEELEIDIDGNPNTIDDATNIRKLNKLTKNKPDGTKTKIKQRIDQLKVALATSLKENGSMFDSNQNILPSYNQGPNFTAFANTGLPQYYIVLHMHQNYFLPDGSTTPKATPVAPSHTDIGNFLKLLQQTDNINTTSILVNRLGTYALRVSNKDSAIDANNLFTAPWPNQYTPNEDVKEFVDAYDRFITEVYQTEPLNDQNVMDAFIKFINTFTFSSSGNTLGISFYQAVYDSEGNIIDWVKL